MSELISIADVVRETNQPRHIINHALMRHGPAPVGRIGIARVWRREDMPRILDSLSKTARNSPTRDEATV